MSRKVSWVNTICKKIAKILRLDVNDMRIDTKGLHIFWKSYSRGSLDNIYSIYGKDKLCLVQYMTLSLLGYLEHKII